MQLHPLFSATPDNLGNRKPLSELEQWKLIKESMEGKSQEDILKEKGLDKAQIAEEKSDLKQGDGKLNFTSRNWIA